MEWLGFLKTLTIWQNPFLTTTILVSICTLLSIIIIKGRYIVTPLLNKYLGTSIGVHNTVESVKKKSCSDCILKKKK